MSIAAKGGMSSGGGGGSKLGKMGSNIRIGKK